MGDPTKTRSITLTCGKLTTGVTVKPWSGIFMLRNLKLTDFELLVSLGVFDQKLMNETITGDSKKEKPRA